MMNMETDCTLEIKRLNLSGYGLKFLDIQVLRLLPSVQEINISNNNLQNVTVVQSTQVLKLNCSNNELKNISFLKDLPNLEELVLYGNPLNLEDYYIAATLCPKLKLIDWKKITFDIQKINDECEEKLRTRILNVWQKKFASGNAVTDIAFNELKKQILAVLKSDKFIKNHKLHKFINFKLESLVTNILTEKRADSSHIPIAKKRKLSSEDDIMPTASSGVRSRSIPSRRSRDVSPIRGRKAPEIVYRGRFKEENPSSNPDCRYNYKNNRKGGDVWMHATDLSHRRRQLDTWDPNGFTAPTVDIKTPSKKMKRIRSPKPKKHKRSDVNSMSSNDDIPSPPGSEISLTDSDLSLVTATERAMDFIESPEPCEDGLKPFSKTGRKHVGCSSSEWSGLKKRKDYAYENKRSKIPAPISRRTQSSPVPQARLRSRTPTISSPSPSQKKDRRSEKSEKYSQRTETTSAYRSPKLSNRVLRKELAIYNDIENWCDDINEHFVSDNKVKAVIEEPDPPPMVKDRSCRRNLSKTRQKHASSCNIEHSQSLKPPKSIPKASPSRSKTAITTCKSGLDKSISKKSLCAKKKDNYRKKLAPLIVSGDDESLDLDPSVHPETINSKLIDESESESSDGGLLSSNETWKKLDSDSNVFDEPSFDDIDSNTEDEDDMFTKRHSNESKRLENKSKKDRRTRSSARSSMTSIKGEERPPKRRSVEERPPKRRSVEERPPKRRSVEERSLKRRSVDEPKTCANRSLRHNSSRLNLASVEYEDSHFKYGYDRSKAKSSSSRGISPSRRIDRRDSNHKLDGFDSPRSKLAEKKSRASIDEQTYSVASIVDRDWCPAHFLKCHSSDNSVDDEKTQVWHCAFEPDSFDRRTHCVATCGGQIVCLIDCDTGRIVHRYKHETSSEEFFALAWTVLKVETGKSEKKLNVLAVGGKRGVILLLQPKQLLCYAELHGHNDMISGLNFHSEVPHILCSGSTDGTIIVWDIGFPKGPELKTDWRHVHIIKVQYDVLNVLFVPQVDFLIAGTENSCWGWTFDARRPSIMTKMPSVEFVHPTKVSGTAQMQSVVDAVVLISNNIIASKCAGYKCIYLWDISATILSTLKKLTRGVRLNIQVLAILQWSDSDNFYLNMGCSRDSKILVCGDACGKLWVYQLSEILAHRRDHKSQQVVSPVILIDWPDCRIKGKKSADKNSLNLNNVVINSACVSSDARFITAVTDKNIVCIWN